MREYLELVLDGKDLTRAESEAVFGSIVEGEIDPVRVSALLAALRTKGEHPDEIAGAAKALRDSALPFERPAYAYADLCGTGGDRAGTLNISTAASVVAAQMGIPVAKHGNRSVSSRCGSADVLEILGVDLEADPAVSRRCLDETGLCFLLGPKYHAGMRHAMPVRRALETRTVMNVLGPLVNPAAPPFQVMGVYDPDLCVPIAFALGSLGCEAALVVHGSGLDEIAVHGPTVAALYRGGAVLEMDLTPEEAGVDRFPLEAIAGGAPAYNAEALVEILEGNGAPGQAAAVAINAGALAWIFGAAPDIREGTRLAMEALEGGECAARLMRMARVSHGA